MLANISSVINSSLLHLQISIQLLHRKRLSTALIEYVYFLLASWSNTRPRGAVIHRTVSVSTLLAYEGCCYLPLEWLGNVLDTHNILVEYIRIFS